jgi:hypothetical protein
MSPEERRKLSPEERRAAFDKEQEARNEARRQILTNFRRNVEALRALRDKVTKEWNYDDGIYRFYHHSFKVVHLQALTLEIVGLLTSLKPTNIEVTIDPMFMQIVAEGTGKEFQHAWNSSWLASTRQIVEAFFHAKFFLEMAFNAAESMEGEGDKGMLPSGWAAILYFYGLR